MKTYQLWNPDHDGWCLFVENDDIIGVVDNGEGWLSSGYEPEEILRQYEEEAPEETLYNWLLETGRATKPEFFYSNEETTIIDATGEIYQNFESAFEDYSIDMAVIINGKLIFCDELYEELEADLDPEGIYKIESGNVLVTVFSRWQGVNPTAKIMTAEEFFEYSFKEVGECS